jgi:hypothetical protein
VKREARSFVAVTVPKNFTCLALGSTNINSASKFSLYFAFPQPALGGDVLMEVPFQVKSSRRDITTVVTFKDESGAMSPVVSCKEHNSRREIYEICEMNEGGEVRTHHVVPT